MEVSPAMVFGGPLVDLSDRSVDRNARFSCPIRPEKQFQHHFCLQTQTKLSRISLPNQQILTSYPKFPYNSKFSIRTMPADGNQGEPARA
jgi:hypothetical protein